MKITHVIRGNDHLSNTPKQILCYEALGYPQPVFAHIPMILGADRHRLSKRHGATSVVAFREEGFLPEAMVNYLARLGWAHGDQEVFTREEMVALFDLRQVGSTAAIFDRTKLEWLNQVWMKRMVEDRAGREKLVTELKVRVEGARSNQLATQARTELVGLEPGTQVPETLWVSAVTNLATRATTLVDLATQARFYFERPAEYEQPTAGRLLTAALGPRLDLLLRRLATLEPWDEPTLEGACRQLAQELGVKLVDLAQPLRLALTGRTASPPLFGIMADLKRQETLARIRALRGRVPSG